MKKVTLPIMIAALLLTTLQINIFAQGKNVAVSSYMLSWDVASTANTATYRAEHYGVFISTTGVNPDDFTLLFEETLSTDEPNWIYLSRELDISAYAGNNIYVAFRHYDITDMDRIVIDNVKIRIAEAGQDDVVLLNEDFQGGIDHPSGEEWLPEGWASLDADGDELNWYFGVRQDEGAMRSQSWDTDPLTPDNWLMTPSIYIGYVGLVENNQFNVSIYPNPVSETLYLKANQAITKLVVYDIQGREVLSTSADKSELSLQLNSLRNGLYILRLQTIEGTVEHKIRVQH